MRKIPIKPPEQFNIDPPPEWETTVDDEYYEYLVEFGEAHGGWNAVIRDGSWYVETADGIRMENVVVHLSMVGEVSRWN
jgi:hypothetical protein